MTNNHYKPGDHKVHCQRCGINFHESQMTKDAYGYIVCKRCADRRHPQEYVRPTKDRISPSSGIIRPARDDTFVTGICSTRSARAGCAISGCALAGIDIPCDIPSGTFSGSGL